jgi:hypothetical protein
LLLIHLIAKLRLFGWHDVDGIAGADFDYKGNVWLKKILEVQIQL